LNCRQFVELQEADDVARLSGGAQFVGNRNVTEEGVVTSQREVEAALASGGRETCRHEPHNSVCGRPSAAEIELVRATENHNSGQAQLE